MLRTRLFLTALVFAATAAIASAATTPTIVTPSSVTWKPVPGFPAGFEMATIVGDPSKAGEYYAYYLKVPSGGKAMPHHHGMTETVVVISGTFEVGLGDTIDMAKMKTLSPGTVVSIPAGVHHYAVAMKGPVVVEISGIGPDTTTMVHK
jgi:quercetin dioxygenase-like cupin family protein